MPTEIYTIIESCYNFIQTMQENPVLFIGTAIMFICFIGTVILNRGQFFFEKKDMGELLIISSLWLSFFGGVMISQRKIIDNRIWLVIFVLLIILWTICFINIFKGFSTKVFWEKLKIYFREEYSIFIVCLILVVIFKIHMDIYPQYDSNLYYGEIIKGINKFSFGLTSFANNFTIWGKQFQPLAPFFVVGELISKGTGKGIYVVNMVLLLGAVICLYEMLKERFSRLTKIQISMLVFIFAVFPFILVGTIYINPDYYCAVLFVFLVYFYLKKYNWLFAYTALALVGSKSNMIITYLLFLFILEIESIFEAKSVKKILRGRPLILWGLPLEIMLFFYYFGVNAAGSMVQGVNSLLEKNVNRFFQAFVFGFKWLVIIAFLLTIITLIYKIGLKKTISNGIKKRKFEVAIVISSFSQFIVYLVMSERLTLCPRYFAQNALAYIILIALILNYMDVSKVIKNFITVVLTVLFTIQAFWTIDPSILYFGASVDFLNGKVYVGTTNYKSELIGIGDGASYNFEYSLWSDLFGKMLKNNYWKDDIVFYSAIDDKHMLTSQDFRYGITFKEYYNVYWDSQNDEITYTKNNESTYKITIESISLNNVGNYANQIASQDVIYMLEPDGMDESMRAVIKDMGYKEVFEEVYINRKTQLKLVVFERE